MFDAGIAREETPPELPPLLEKEEYDWYDVHDPGRMKQGGITRRIRDLGIHIDYWNEAEEKTLRREAALTRIDNKEEGQKLEDPIEPYRNVPFDIASCILLHLPDLTTLASAIFINRTFAASFHTTRVSITRTILLTMFGKENLDHALILAWLLNDHRRMTNMAGHIVITQPDTLQPLPSPLIDSLVEIYRVTNIWVELWETRKIWMHKPKSRLVEQRVVLSEDSRIRLIKAIMMYWAYTACARRILGSEDPLHGHSPNPTSKMVLEDRGIFDFFTHFDLLETRALYDFYAEAARAAVEEFKKDKLPVDPDWQYLARSRGPVWMLRLLAREGVEGRIIYERLGPLRREQTDSSFFWLDAAMEIAKRGLRGIQAGFTSKKRGQMIKELMRMGIDGDDGSMLGASGPGTDEVD